MNNSFLVIDDFLTKDERQHFLSLIDSDAFTIHPNPKGGSLPIETLRVPFRDLDEVCVLGRMKPHAAMWWHKDRPESHVSLQINNGLPLLRNCSLNHPITDNYAPTKTIDGDVSQTNILNTQKMHAVYNNEHTRLVFQICLNVDFDYLMSDMHHRVWDLVYSL